MKDIIKIQNPDKVWFVSDTHYWHKNITYGESVWNNKETACRRFDTTKEMSQHIVSQINRYVKEDDILIHLGDWSFSGVENIWNFRKQLKVKTIYFCQGNHDNLIIKHYAETQSLFTIVDNYLEIMVGKDLFCCMHYPIEEWNDRHHKAYMLHGHSHGNSPYKKDRLDVGIDNAFKLFGEYKPFNYQEIKDVFRKQE